MTRVTRAPDLIRGLFRIVGIGLFALAALPASAGSLSVEPLFIEVMPGSSAAVRVRNTSDSPITVELTVEERTIDAEGVQSRTDAEDSFILFPPQGVIEPQGIQVFRMQPIAADPEKSHSYFLTVKQLPVTLDPIEGGGTRLQVVFAFDVAVHTTPRGSKTDPQLVRAVLDTTEISKQRPADAPPLPADAARPEAETMTVPAIAVTLRNDGNKYLYLHDLDYVATGIDANGNEVDIPSWDENAVLDAVRVTLVQPGATRTFKLPLIDLPTLTSIDVRIRQRAGR